MSSISVRKYVIKGQLKKGGELLPFTKEVKATKKEDAIQQLYMDIGSRHKAKRHQINILKVEEREASQEEAIGISEQEGMA